MSELRPTFAERDRYLDLLSTAYADGRLDEKEFEARSNGVLAAVTHRDAMAQFEGLPRPAIAPVDQPPAAFRPQPGPPAVFEPRPNRRGLLVGGVAVVAVAGLGLAGVTVMRAPTSMSGGVEEMWMPGEFAIDSIFIDGVSEAMAALADRGFDQVAHLRVTMDQITGMATTERSPGEGAEFVFTPGGALDVTEDGVAGAPAGVPLAEVERWTATAVEATGFQASGEVVDLEMSAMDGAPHGTVWVSNGSSTGWAEIDANGELVSFQTVEE